MWKKKSRIMVAVAVLFGALFGGMASAPAFAAQTAPCVQVDGNTGILCAKSDPQGYRVSFQKTSGAAATYDFNLVCNNGRWFGDEGAFYATSGNTYSYVFAVGDQGSCQGRLIKTSTGASWNSFAVTHF